MTVERKFLRNKFNVARAEVQKLSPEIAAKLFVKRVKLSTIWNNHEKQARMKHARILDPSLPASVLVRLLNIAMIVIIKLERQAVPKDGPNAFLNERFVLPTVEEPAGAKYH